MKLRSIQVLRAVAACAVVVLHAYNYVDLHSVARVGAAGVDLFFVISGFIMATVAAGKTPGRFLADRAWRILPLWFIAVTPWLLGQHNSAQTVAASPTLWMIYPNTLVLPALHLGWTLSFEFLFYFAFALALATRPLVPLAAYAAFLVLGLLTNLILFEYIGNPLVLEFFAGVVIAHLPRARLGPALMLCGFAWIALGPLNTGYALTPSYYALLRVGFWGVGAAMIFYGAVSCERLFGSRAWNAPVFLGNASYSIYLFHMLVVPNLAWPVSVAAGIGLGSIVHVVLERRIVTLRSDLRRLRQGRTPPESKPAPAAGM